MTQLTPPLLAMMAGRKVRPRRARVPAPKELLLHMPVAKVLREHCLWEWTHFPSGEERSSELVMRAGKLIRFSRAATKLKQMGLARYWPDFILISPRGMAYFLELKRLGEDLSPGQADFRIRCIARGNPYVVAWTMEQVLLAFEQWECLRVKFTPRKDNLNE